MKKSLKSAIGGLAVASALAVATPASAATIVGGQEMFPTMTIVENAANSADHTTLVAAVKAAGLVDTLNQDGPFTVFAPVNSAFDALPSGTVETLLMPENKDQLTAVLTYHVVPGQLNFVRLRNMIRKGRGEAKLETVAGGILTARLNGSNNIMLIDGKGRTANIQIYDVIQSNGVIHSIDSVLLPQ